jgi:hypothetical protein
LKNFYLYIFTFCIFFFSQSFSNDQLNRLNNLYKKGLISKEEFDKALILVEKKTSEYSGEIKINKINESASGKKFEKLEFYLDNYRVYMIRPGAIKIDNMKTGETDVFIRDIFKVKMNKTGKKFFKLVFDESSEENNKKYELHYQGRILFTWQKRFVQRYNANFLQLQLYGYIPFHFYIKIPGKKIIGLNVDDFTDKINKAIDAAKLEIAQKYNITVNDIDRILANKNKKINNEIEKVISEEQKKAIKELTEKYAGQEITDAIRQEIERTIGQEMADAFISAIEDASGQAIDEAIEAEIANEIDRAINDAVQLGVTRAAAEAAIAAMLYVYAMGGTDAQAMEACRAYAGDAC